MTRRDRGQTQAAPKKLENRLAAPGSRGRGGGQVRAWAAGVGASSSSPRLATPRALCRWRGQLDITGPSPQPGSSPRSGAENGQGCAEAWATLGWAAAAVGDRKRRWGLPCGQRRLRGQLHLWRGQLGSPESEVRLELRPKPSGMEPPSPQPHSRPEQVEK